MAILTARTKKETSRYSDTGNRTPSWRVRDADVSHYTISDWSGESHQILDLTFTVEGNMLVTHQKICS